ncbi:MAG TPA: hypothetical protein P5527_08070, partial [Kiritimatiellia bacterium]|nr:hypothetical protein [Kiritimatiellia bacterium]
MPRTKSPMQFILITVAMLCACAASAAQSELMARVAACDETADAAVAAIRTPEELAAKQRAWRATWL